MGRKKRGNRHHHQQNPNQTNGYKSVHFESNQRSEIHSNGDVNDEMSNDGAADIAKRIMINDTAAAATADDCTRSTWDGTVHVQPMSGESGEIHPSGTRSNWFSKVRWVSRNDAFPHDIDNEVSGGDRLCSLSSLSSLRHTSPFPKEHFVHSPHSPTCQSDKSDKSDTSSPSTSPSPHTSLLQELQKLNTLKERLTPAAEACANAINNQPYSSRATTPEYEFRQARSACNPYESLGETFSKNHARHFKTQQKQQKQQKRRKKGKRGNSNQWPHQHPQQLPNQQPHQHPQHPNQPPPSQSTGNEYEAPSGLSQFVNRSAIKLANIDALLGFCLTSPSTNDAADSETGMTNDSATGMTNGSYDSYFAFVDLCGAPGGFSEYILYRHVHPALRCDTLETCHNEHNEYNEVDGISGIWSSGKRKYGCSTDGTGGTDGTDGTDDRPNDGSERSERTNKEILPCYGFGMSLTGTNKDGKGVPWDLDHLKRHHLQYCDEKGNSKLHYHLCKGADGTGSIYNWDNVLQLQREIWKVLPHEGDPSSTSSTSPTTAGSTPVGSIDVNSASVDKSPEPSSTSNNEGIKQPQPQHQPQPQPKPQPSPLVHLVVADGGFDAQRDSLNQESLAHPIIVSQTAAALTLLRPGGSYVLKLFGFRELATQRVLRYLYGCFEKMTFVKPILSRPASAERYLVCCGFDGVCCGWDGLVWKENMMGGDVGDVGDTDTVEGGEVPDGVSGISSSGSKFSKFTSLDALMELFDMEMIRLNMDTCKAIIQYLDEKKQHAENGDDMSQYRKRRRCLDLGLYEDLWQIV